MMVTQRGRVATQNKTLTTETAESAEKSPSDSSVASVGSVVDPFLAAHGLLRTAYRLLPTAYCLLPTRNQTSSASYPEEV